MISMTWSCTPSPRRLSVSSGEPSRLSIGAMLPTSASSSMVSSVEERAVGEHLEVGVPVLPREVEQFVPHERLAAEQGEQVDAHVVALVHDLLHQAAVEVLVWRVFRRVAPSQVRLQRMVGLMRIVVGALLPVDSTSFFRLSTPRRRVFTIRHSIKASRQRGLSFEVTCLAISSAGWSSSTFSVTKRTEPLYWSGVIFSASWNALTILLLVVAGRQLEHLIDHLPLRGSVEAARTAHPSPPFRRRAPRPVARVPVVVVSERRCRAASTPGAAAWTRRLPPTVSTCCQRSLSPADGTGPMQPEKEIARRPLPRERFRGAASLQEVRADFVRRSPPAARLAG